MRLRLHGAEARDVRVGRETTTEVLSELGRSQQRIVLE
jgi:hypothetical protein